MALTRTQIETLFKAVINYAETTSSYLATRMDSLDSALLSANTGTRFYQTITSAKNWRSNAGNILSPSQITSLLNGNWAEVVEFLNLPFGTSFNDVFHEFRDNMIANSKTVNSRDMTLGSPAAAGGNTGTGELLRLKLDDNDQQLEACHVESQSLEITSDQSTSGASRHNEQAIFRGSTNPIDGWTASKFTVSGLTSNLKVSSESDSLLQNPSFDSYTPFEAPFVGPLTSLSGWSAGSGTTIGTDYGIDSTGVAGTNYFTSNSGASKPASLKILTLTAGSIYQYLTVNRKIEYRTPYVPILYYNREVGSAAGDLTVTWGSKSQTLSLGSETGWNRFPIVLDKKLYPKNWLTDQPRFTISWDLSAGTLLVDKVIFKPMTFFDGNWYILLGGVTPFKIGDSFTWSNTLAGADAIIQKWMGLLYGLSLPHATSGGETWADPTVIA